MPLVRVRELRVGFGRRDSVPVVDGVSFELHAGRALAIVGESGSGKSVTARSLVGLAGAGSWQSAEALDVLGASVLGPGGKGTGAGRSGGRDGRGERDGRGDREGRSERDGRGEREGRGWDAQEGDRGWRGGDAEGGRPGDRSGRGDAGRGDAGRGMSAAAWRRIRGRQIGLIVQDALVSLDPLRPIGREIADGLRLHTTLSVAQRQARVLELLDSVGMPDPASRIGQRSGELSGGLRQRALIAAGLSADPPVLIADEPTTALDATVQAQILSLLETVKARGTALLFISHDLAVVSRIADDVLVMRGGRVVESGPTDAVLRDPQHAYTRALLRAVPTDVPRRVRLSAPSAPAAAFAHSTRPEAGENGADLPTSGRVVPPATGGKTAVLEVRGVRKAFPIRGAGRGVERVAVDDVSVVLERGTTLGLVGESGSGKTTLARIVLGLTAPDAGTVTLDGQPWAPLPERQRRPRRNRLGAVYQDALSSFDPRLTVQQILADARSGRRDAHSDPLAGAGATTSMREPLASIAQLVDDVGLTRSVLERRPLELSGGQRQRVSIARALAADPAVLICDEPVSALDVSIQAQILDLFDELQQRHGLSYLFISHDLGVVQHMSDRIAVMKDGRIVEEGETAAVFASPAHPYTQALLAAAPRLTTR
ncbi:ABC transporter ATP-binding protein [Herbiconiux sp. CPCC 205763]|uniref:ABC transporter ATP-binding protein n=1 Tax=Herbiconiux aconitum TaxID=2970913 RepID=A0ABT2GUH8_9MICO|nr:ABC transporter ATP-binding protein [Herbiconiux aconitum]MCS5719862.1 ABC transporter ATP-binding protein [Herbiconiux aconitum]